MEKNYEKPVDSDIKQFEEIRKLTTSEGENYINYIKIISLSVKNLYRLIEADLNRQKELMLIQKQCATVL